MEEALKCAEASGGAAQDSAGAECRFLRASLDAALAEVAATKAEKVDLEAALECARAAEHSTRASAEGLTISLAEATSELARTKEALEAAMLVHQTALAAADAEGSANLEALRRESEDVLSSTRARLLSAEVRVDR